MSFYIFLTALIGLIHASKVSEGPPLSPPRLDAEPKRWFAPAVDPCQKLRGIKGGNDPDLLGQAYFLSIADLRSCLAELKMTNHRALWTLHNLHFGVSETYSFTDLALDSQRSVHASECGFRVHDVQVDLRATLRQRIIDYDLAFAGLNPTEVKAELSGYIAAFPFHQELLSLFNQLHDAHTTYAPPLEMFRVYSPISFGSKLVLDRISQDLVQVVTLRLFSGHTPDYLRVLARMHRKVYGRQGSFAGDGFPISERHHGEVVTHINGMDALEFLKRLTLGPLAAKFQQQEQRLNAFVFSAEALVFPLIQSTLPDFDSLVLQLADSPGREFTVNLLGQFSDLATAKEHAKALVGVDLATTRGLSQFMHNNKAFDAFMKHETVDLERDATLYTHFRHQGSGNHERLGDLSGTDWNRVSQKHRAFVDPLNNANRDALAILMEELPMHPRGLFHETASVIPNPQHTVLAARRTAQAVANNPFMASPCASQVNSPLVKKEVPCRPFIDEEELEQMMLEDAARRAAKAMALNPFMASPLNSFRAEEEPLDNTQEGWVTSGNPFDNPDDYSEDAEPVDVANTFLGKLLLQDSVQDALWEELDPTGSPDKLLPESPTPQGYSQYGSNSRDYEHSQGVSVTPKDYSQNGIAEWEELSEDVNLLRYSQGVIEEHYKYTDVHRGAMAAGGDVEMRGPFVKVSEFTQIGSLGYSFAGSDTIVVRIESFLTKPWTEHHALFPEFVQIQQIAKERKVRRLLFDVSNNSGGAVVSAYAMLWYLMADPARICAPMRKRITAHWAGWLTSFGRGLDALVDEYLVPKGETLVDELDAIFSELEQLTNLMFEGLGLTEEIIGPDTNQSSLLKWLTGQKAKILAFPTKTQRAAAIVTFIKHREFLNGLPDKGSLLVPRSGFYPFDADEMSKPGAHGQCFQPTFLQPYQQVQPKTWGSKESNYSQLTEYKFCAQAMSDMAILNHGKYDFGYWAQIAFVSDGTCGSACALFTQGMQTNGDAVAFSYGGLADTPIDVGSFAGGNVEEYDDFWPKLAYAAKLGTLVSRGQAPWSQAHEHTWIASPIAFPTRAKAKFNWNMVFSPALGPDALPRQFYIIPARKHINVWASTPSERASVYAEIVGIREWGKLIPQFRATHGVCPREASDLFTTAHRERVYSPRL